MQHSLTMLIQNASITTLWDSVSPVLAAFIGGGLVTLIVDVIRNSRRARNISRLFKSEIKMNLDVFQSAPIKEHPWLTHKIWSSFYDSNSIEVICFPHTIAEKIVQFYALLDTLKFHHELDKEITILDKEGKYDAAAMMRSGGGQMKQELRLEMIKLGNVILKA